MGPMRGGLFLQTEFSDVSTHEPFLSWPSIAQQKQHLRTTSFMSTLGVGNRICMMWHFVRDLEKQASPRRVDLNIRIECRSNAAVC